MKHELTSDEITLILKASTFQMKVMMRIPKEIVTKAMMEAVANGEITLDDVPSPDEFEAIMEKLGIPSSEKMLN